MTKKYEFTGLSKEFRVSNRKVTLHQIRAIRSFGEIEQGTIGGWIGLEYNLSHDGNAWVGGNALVADESKVFGGRFSD